jgi:hypothetical protein
MRIIIMGNVNGPAEVHNLTVSLRMVMEDGRCIMDIPLNLN